MQTQTIGENISLYFREGGSDKIYQAALEPSGPDFIVTFAYGRRGSTLQTGTKTSRPVGYGEAKKIYDKLVKEKTARGYSPGAHGTPYAQTDNEQRATGILPQLPNPIGDDEIEWYLTNDAYLMQEKFDGRRVLIQKQGDRITGINRTGLTVGLPLPIAEAMKLLDVTDCLLDGEAVGDVYHAFDLLQMEGADLKPSPYAVRHAAIVELVDGVPSDSLRFAAFVAGTNQKRVMLDRLKKEKKEGVVFKDHSAPYTPGRPASGGPQLKLKFYATASCIVAAINAGKRSVALNLMLDHVKVSVGNVTIPPNHVIPAAGSVVEIRYLYAYPGGSLYQPVYLGVRDDITATACAMAQLKFKAGDDAGEQ